MSPDVSHAVKALGWAVAPLLVVPSLAACGRRDEVGDGEPLQRAARDVGASVAGWAGCPPDEPRSINGPAGLADYADFVQLGGRTYQRVMSSPTVQIPLGEIVGEVCATLSRIGLVTSPHRDGDASQLPVGTTLHRLPTGDPALRVAAATRAGVVVYEVAWLDDASVGADVIDLTDDVVAIGINSEIDNSPIAAITDAGTVARLVHALATAPVEPERSDVDRDGPRYFVELRRADGTTTTRAYWIETGELWHGISLPASWRRAIDAAVGPNPPTTPPPTTTPLGTMPATSSTVPAVAVGDLVVQHLATVLGLDGPLEHRDGGRGTAQCVGRLERRGVCVNAPLWGYWQYFDVDAQRAPVATDDEAAQVALALFARLGVDAGSVASITPNGPHPLVRTSGGASVMVAAGGRVVMVIAPTHLLPR